MSSNEKSKRQTRTSIQKSFSQAKTFLVKKFNKAREYGGHRVKSLGSWIQGILSGKKRKAPEDQLLDKIRKENSDTNIFNRSLNKKIKEEKGNTFDRETLQGKLERINKKDFKKNKFIFGERLKKLFGDKRSDTNKNKLDDMARKKKFWQRFSLERFIKSKKTRVWVKRLAIAGGAMILLGLIFLVGLFIYYTRFYEGGMPSKEELENIKYAESTKIYDKTGEVLLYEIHGEEKRTLISLDEMPDYLKQATLAVEDDNFYNHHGVDFWGLVQGVVINPLRGRRARGGSTITQQLIKNTLLTSERTLSRKIQEVVLSFELENRYEKDEILEMYLNRIPYGSNAYGVQAAAKTFFDKDAKDLTLGECAILASLPNRPSYLSPYGSHPDALQERQEYILDRMVSLGYISENEKNEAIEEKIVEENKFHDPSVYMKAPHFVFYVKELLEEAAQNEGKYGGDIETAGLKVITTLDWDLQQQADQIVKDYAASNDSIGIQNMALAAVEPDTGHVVTMVGSRDYFDKENDGNVNVTIRDRQPGSSFKPYVYAAAFEKGYTPNTILYDVKTSFGNDGSGKEYIPDNYSGSFSGPVSIRSALAQSLNIPAVKGFYLAGSNQTMSLANSMGLSNLDPNASYGLSSALGTKEVKLVEHAGAMGTFGNQGEKVPVTPILKIENKDGEVVEDNTDSQTGEQVLDANVANMINDVLSDNGSRTFGQGVLVVPGYDVAAKTGTSNRILSNGSTRPGDVWTVGYSPKLSAAVWAGNNDNSVLDNRATGVSNAAPAWQAFMKVALQKYENESFTNPSIPSTGKGVLDGQKTVAEEVTICKFEGKLATENTPASQRETKSYGKSHSILYYVNKDDPLGDRPENPENDPQFTLWEKAVLAWAGGENIEEMGDVELGTPPTENCTVHEPEYHPNVTITAPSNGANIDTPSIVVRVTASSPLTAQYSEIGIKQVEFYLNGQRVGIKSGSSGTYEFTMNLSSASGATDISVKVFDTIDNMTEKSITINVTPVPADSLDISASTTSTTFSSNVDLEAVFATMGSNDLVQVDFYYNFSGADVLIGSDTSGVNAGTLPDGRDTYQYAQTWTTPGSGAGNYSVYAIGTYSGGGTITSNTITISVS